MRTPIYGGRRPPESAGLDGCLPLALSERIADLYRIVRVRSCSMDLAIR